MYPFKLGMQEPEKTLVNRLGRKLIENDVENRCCKMARERNWDCEKFTSPQRKSVPDRMLTTWPYTSCGKSLIFFIELKAPKKKPTELQKIDHRGRREKNVMVFVADCYEELELIFEAIEWCLDNNTLLLPEEIPEFLLE